MNNGCRMTAFLVGKDENFLYNEHCGKYYFTAML